MDAASESRLFGVGCGLKSEFAKSITGIVFLYLVKKDHCKTKGHRLNLLYDQ